jgi:uncharacterized protein (TIGR02271 family)
MTEKDNQDLVIPVIEEELAIAKRAVKTGSVRVQKHRDIRTEIVSMPLVRHTVDIQRIPVGREVSSVPEIRTEGATTIIPVVEEEIVITKRLILKEEVHLTRRYGKEIGSKQVDVSLEHAEIVRMDAEGRVVAREGEPDRNRRTVRRRSIR